METTSLVVQHPDSRGKIVISDTAVLSNTNGYSVFEFGDYSIRFAAPYSLENYESVKTWDNGYLVVMAKYKHNQEAEEEYIDLIPVLRDLYIDEKKFLEPIKQVVIKNEV